MSTEICFFIPDINHISFSLSIFNIKFILITTNSKNEKKEDNVNIIKRYLGKFKFD